jgi:hypothetical protein
VGEREKCAVGEKKENKVKGIGKHMRGWVGQ